MTPDEPGRAGRRSPNIDKILRDNLIDALREDGNIPEDRIETLADELQALAKKTGEQIRSEPTP